MAKPANWRDLTKTTRSGLVIPAFRLSLPFGEVVLTGAARPESDRSAANRWSVRCFSCGVQETPITAESPEKARKAALDLIKSRLVESIEHAQQNLDAIKKIDGPTAKGPSGGPAA